MMALSGVRNSWLMVARKRLLAALARSASAARVLKRLFLALALGHVAKHGDNLATIVGTGLRPPAVPSAGSAFRSRQIVPPRPRGRLGAVATDAKLDGSALAQRRSIAERRQISRPVGDMNAAEQTLAVQIRNPAAEQRLRPQATRTAPRHRGRAG